VFLHFAFLSYLSELTKIFILRVQRLTPSDVGGRVRQSTPARAAEMYFTAGPNRGRVGLAGYLIALASELHFITKFFVVARAQSASNEMSNQKEPVMIALGLVRVIEQHSDDLAAELIAKLETSSRTTDLRKVPVEELRRGIQEILRHLGEWLLTKTGRDIEQRYFEIGGRRASQGVALSDFCWSIALTKGHLWEFLQRQGVMGSPIEIYGEMELLRLLDQFFDRALCFAAEGYEQYVPLRNGSDSRAHEARKAAW
jgi:hypothetical protein